MYTKIVVKVSLLLQLCRLAIFFCSIPYYPIPTLFEHGQVGHKPDLIPDQSKSEVIGLA